MKKTVCCVYVYSVCVCFLMYVCVSVFYEKLFPLFTIFFCSFPLKFIRFTCMYVCVMVCVNNLYCHELSAFLVYRTFISVVVVFAVVVVVVSFHHTV